MQRTACRTLLRLTCLLLPVCCWAAIDQQASAAAAQKLQQLAEGRYESGTVVEITEDELNAFLRFHAAAAMPEGVRDPELEFRYGGAVIRALVNLDEVGGTATGLSPLVRMLLRGEQNVAVDIDYAVREGEAAVRVVGLTINEAEIGGAVLEWFLQAFAPPEVLPYLNGQSGMRQEGVRETVLEPGRALVVVE